MDIDGNSFEYNTMINFADDLDKIGVISVSTDDIRKYAAAAEAYSQTVTMNYDAMNTIEDFNL